MNNKKNDTTPTIKIAERVFLGNIKLEEYLRKEVERLLEKYKNK